MSKEFLVVIERDEAGYLVASVPSLKGCHTQARSMDELMARVREAIQLCLEVGGRRKVGSTTLIHPTDYNEAVSGELLVVIERDESR